MTAATMLEVTDLGLGVVGVGGRVVVEAGGLRAERRREQSWLAWFYGARLQEWLWGGEHGL
ncbi:hypothetical protein CDL15_Pgr023486 [Punica granatum]|uniref:Uncharacterized protein n=1 Tax=Punica granatum TaxID=22663 RepID=A0A218W8K3_PUNGR|nr:hypothetical protein CDL15_Pgr023486 [Punica granatum]